MIERFVLAVDQGTGGPKVGLVSTAGEVAWARHFPVPTRRTPDGGAVQDAEAWWTLIRDAAREALAGGAVDVAAVSVTSQWGSVVPTDGDGRPVGDCLLWEDTRGRRHAQELIGGPLLGYHPRRLAAWIRRTGGAPSPTGGDPISHMLHLQREQPDVAAAARWFLEPADYLTMRFSGRPVASPASMIAAWLTDNRRPDRIEYAAELVALAGIDANRLAPLVPTATVVGNVRPDVARELGLADGVPVVAGTADLHAAAVGAGALDDFAGHVAISTTSWISCPVPSKKTDPLRSIASVPGLPPAGYVIADCQDSAGACLQWLRDHVLGGTYEELVALAARATPGSGGVIFAPWLAGERSPMSDRRARGGWHNVSLGASRAELARGARRRRLQRALAAGRRGALHRPPHAVAADHRRRRGRRPVVPDLRRRARPPHRAGRGSGACPAARRRPAGRAQRGSGRARGGGGPRAGRPGLHARAGGARGLRPPGARAAAALPRSEADLRPTQPGVGNQRSTL